MVKASSRTQPLPGDWETESSEPLKLGSCKYLLYVILKYIGHLGYDIMMIVIFCKVLAGPQLLIIVM